MTASSGAIDLGTVQYNHAVQDTVGNGSSPFNAQFIAPKTGYYHFVITKGFISGSVTGTPDFTNDTTIEMFLAPDAANTGFKKTIGNQQTQYAYQKFPPVYGNGVSFQLTLDTVVYMVAGDKATLAANWYSQNTFSSNPGRNYISPPSCPDSADQFVVYEVK